MNLVVLQQLSGPAEDRLNLLSQAQRAIFQQRALMSRSGLRQTYCQLLLDKPGSVAILDFWDSESDYQCFKLALGERNLRLLSANPNRLLSQTSEFVLVKAMTRENFLPHTVTALLIETAPGSNLAATDQLLRSAMADYWPSPALTGLWLGQNLHHRHQFLFHLVWNNARAAADFLAEGGLLLPNQTFKLKLYSYSTSLPFDQLAPTHQLAC